MEYEQEGSSRIETLTYIMDIEQILGADHSSARHVHERNASRLVLNFRCPECDQVLTNGCRLSGSLRFRVLGVAFTLAFELLFLLVRHWSPLKVHHTINLETLLAEEAHRWSLVDGDLLLRRDAAEVLLIWRPLEHRPDNTFVEFVRLITDHWERAQQLARDDVPHGDMIAFVFFGERRQRAQLVGGFDRTRRPRDEVALEWREIDELDFGMCETVDTIERRSSPESDSRTVDRSEEGTVR